MERSKGKIRLSKSGISLWVADLLLFKCFTSSVRTTEAKHKANAAHLVKCWNAFEEGGIVGEMAGLLEEIANSFKVAMDGHMDIAKKLGKEMDYPEGKLFIKQAKAVLTQYKEIDK
ncbi:hypothetical protein LCGC14_0359000 [marine sediment metagenome]|uniref:Uncharacterized protein n=1 Tax=marine sediment metagenome TaxID=412755 RepID=A0A0F9T8T1_9ZZZZ